MVVSNDTALNIYNSFKRYLTARQIRLLLDDLAQIPGNQSFRDTITRLMHLHANKVAEGKDDLDNSKEEKQGGTGA
jgi:hypothetical protein